MDKKLTEKSTELVLGIPGRGWHFNIMFSPRETDSEVGKWVELDEERLNNGRC